MPISDFLNVLCQQNFQECQKDMLFAEKRQKSK
jgi:hypothetical protein